MKKEFYSPILRILFFIFAMFATGQVTFGQIISTVAGNGSTGYSGDGGQATGAGLYFPKGVAVDNSGNIFIGDYNNQRIRKIAPSGIITSVAGGGSSGLGDGGPATDAQLSTVFGVAIDRSGNIYIGDYANHRIRKVSPSGIITTIAGNGSAGYSGDGGQGTAAEINAPRGVAVDTMGNVYFAEWSNHVIRMVSPSGIISTFAGTGSGGFSGDGGSASAATLSSPSDLSIDIFGNVYISDQSQRIRKINTAGIINTIAGIAGSYGYSGDGGPATSAKLNYPMGVSTDSFGNVYIADNSNNRIRRISPSGIISTIAGTASYGFSGDGGVSTAAQISAPWGLTVGPGGDVYFADMYNHRIRKFGSCFPVVASITGSTIVCEGAAITLFDSTTGGSWSSGTSTAATVSSSGVVTGLSAGTIIVSYSLTGSCGTTTMTRSITVTAAPSAASIHGIDTLCPGFTTTLIDTATGGTWVSSNTSIATVSSTGVVTSVAPGTVNMLYIITNSCGSDTATFPFSVRTPGACNTSVNMVGNEHSLAIFPNPNKGSFTFNLSSGSNDEVQIIITNILGEKIKQMKTTTNKATVVQLNVPSGVYFISAATANEQYIDRVLVE